MDNIMSDNHLENTGGGGGGGGGGGAAAAAVAVRTPQQIHDFINRIYATLFPYIITGGSMNNSQSSSYLNRINNCFENGAFVFEDKDRDLFNYLLPGASVLRQYRALRGIGGASLSHLIPRIMYDKAEDRDSVHENWKDIDVRFFGQSKKNIVVPILRNNMLQEQWWGRGGLNWSNVPQYERRIDPPLEFLCNPECREGAATGGVAEGGGRRRRSSIRCSS